MDAVVAQRSSIEAQIRSAFAGVTLGGGTSLRQAEVIDRYGEGMTDADFASLPQSEITDDWSKLPLSELDRDCIAHLDDAGLHYYLPALMLSLLSHYDPTSMRVIGTIQALYVKPPHPERPVQRFGRLTDSQRAAVANFLHALPRLVDLGTEDAKCVTRAMRNYWGRYFNAGMHDI